MKKFLLSSLALLGMAGMAYAGTGTQADPYTVKEVVDMYNANTSIDMADVYVQGYIVGSMADANSTTLSNTTFGASPASNTNLVLAGFSAEDDYRYCVAVQLPNTDVRTALSLQQNPNNLGHQVLLKGRINKYCSGAGLRDTSEFEWIGEAPVPGGGNTGGGTGNGTGSSLSSGLGDFTIENVGTLPSGVNFVWEWSTQYNCAKATGYINGQAYTVDSYLVSPEINLGTATTATIDQALSYLNGMNMDDNIGIYVREGANGTWNRVSYTNPPAGNSFTFVTSQIDLAAYTGKTIQVGFRYTSTSAGATTWEIKNFVVGGSSSTPETPGTPQGVSVTFDFSDPTLYGFNPTDDQTEILLAGETFEKDGVTITFGQNGNPSTGIRLFKSSAGRWSFRFYKDTYFTVTAPDGNHLNGMVFEGSNLDKNWSYSSGTFAVNTWTATTETDEVTISKTATGDNPVIDALTVYYSDGEFNPDSPVTPPADDLGNVTFNFGDPTVYGFNPTDDQTEIPLAGETFTNEPVTLTFAQTGNPSTGIRLFKSTAGRWSFRFYKDTSFTVSVPDGYSLAKIEFAGNNLGTDWSYSNGSFSGTTWTASGTTNSVTIGKTATGNNPVIDSMTIYYSDGSGVEEVLATDDSEAVYYNLQGVKVAHPERGIYIKVVGNKAVKVLK